MHARAAFTIIEVTIAMVILVLVLTTVVSSMGSIGNANRMAREDRRAQEIAQIMVERIQGENWHQLGRKPWSWHRRVDAEFLTALQYVDELGSESPLEFKHRPLIDEPSGPQLYTYLRSINDTVGSTGGDLVDFSKDDFGLPYTSDDHEDEFSDDDSAAVAPAPAVGLPAILADKYQVAERYNWLQYLGLLDGPSGLANLRVFLEYYRQDSILDVTSRADWQGQRNEASNRYPQSHLLLDLAAEGTSLDREAIILVVTVLWDRAAGGEGRYEIMVARRK